MLTFEGRLLTKWERQRDVFHSCQPDRKDIPLLTPAGEQLTFPCGLGVTSTQTHPRAALAMQLFENAITVRTGRGRGVSKMNPLVRTRSRVTETEHCHGIHFRFTACLSHFTSLKNA